MEGGNNSSGLPSYNYGLPGRIMEVAVSGQEGDVGTVFVQALDLCHVIGLVS